MQWLSGRLFLITPLLILSPTEGREERWSIKCPGECSCHLSHFKDLPMRKWLVEESTGQKRHSKETYEYNNEALYYEDATPKGYADEDNDLMRMAICILKKDSEPGDLLEKLPSNLEVLTLLQSPDSEYVTLGESIFHNQLDLVALEIQGFHGNGDSQVSGHHSNSVLLHYPFGDITTKNHQDEERITLHIESIHQLHSLEYLNLQYVKLEGNGYMFHDNTRPMPLKTANYKYDVDEDELDLKLPDHDMQMSHHLVFLSPEPEDEILPYMRYRQEQENLKSSIYIGLPNLVFIRLFACGLKEINWKMFDGLPQLEYLSLEENELRFIPEFTFYGAPNLKILSLSYNKLLSLQSTSLAGLLDLRKLDLSHNNFSHLSELSLPPFPHLKTADFRHNPIKTVFSSTFEIMNATEILFLGGDETGIEIIQNSFSGLSSLLKLSIHNVKINKIERVTLMGMPNLKELEMKGSVDTIEFDAFAEVPKLEQLTMKHCHIKAISMDAFYGVYRLIYLDLSYNELETLPPGIFDQQSSLKELILQNNHFRQLPERVFQYVQAKMIRLEGNPWHCSCSMMDWRETSINKVKEEATSMCQNHYDKGITCGQSVKRYVYDKRVAPQCETPAKYKNWSVFHVLRKVLRCKKYNQKPNGIKKLYGNYISHQGISGVNASNVLEKKWKSQNEQQLSPSLVEQDGSEKDSEIKTTLIPQTTEDLNTFSRHYMETTSDQQFSTYDSIQQSTAIEENISTDKVNGMKVIKHINKDSINHSSLSEMTYIKTQPTIVENMYGSRVSQNSSTMVGIDNKLDNDLMGFLNEKNERSNDPSSSTDFSSSNANKYTVNSDISKKHKVVKKEGNMSPIDKEHQFLFDGNKRLKVSKKAYKLEIERKAKEKLKANKF
ncbi:uncharacterized protein [Hetaerina americana]|uniref:uncharacterized protein n=1 Tax=Hetaerina americana TaxID=62018 RepID=UPI003A7F17AC